MSKIKTIRSSGQTGVERAALDIAKERKIQICGWCANSGLTKNYITLPEILEIYPQLQEIPDEDTSQCIVWNVKDSDATLIIEPKNSDTSKDTNLASETAIKLNRPLFKVKSYKDIEGAVKWLDKLDKELILNITGPKESECSEAYIIATRVLNVILSNFK